MVKAVTVCNYMQAVSMREREKMCVIPVVSNPFTLSL